jgi:chemotaxis protein MotA
VIKANVAAVAICVAVFVASFIVSGNVGAYLNVQALLVVLSGTVGATFLSFPWSQIRNAFFVARNAYGSNVTTPDQIIEALLDLSVRSRLDGLQSLEEAGEKTTLRFLSNAMTMLADNYPEESIRDILTTEAAFFRQRRKNIERVFRVMAAYAPAFGLAGSIIGLIGLLFGLGDTGEVLKYIPIALISTLYGILLGNFVLAPVAEVVRDRTEREMLAQRMIIEGAAAIKTETNPHMLERKLTSFLTPSKRGEASETFADIRQKYIRMARARKTRQPGAEAEQAAGPGPADEQ